jgi:hypothetical protein
MNLVERTNGYKMSIAVDAMERLKNREIAFVFDGVFDIRIIAEAISYYDPNAAGKYFCKKEDESEVRIVSYNHFNSNMQVRPFILYQDEFETYVKVMRKSESRR